VNQDGNTFIGNLQFSKKGFAAWKRNKRAILDKFEGLTNQMVDEAGMHAAFSLHDPSGTMAGGCARKRTDRLATCR
jgi:hypothetical protein